MWRMSSFSVCAERHIALIVQNYTFFRFSIYHPLKMPVEKKLNPRHHAPSDDSDRSDYSDKSDDPAVEAKEKVGGELKKVYL